MSQNDKPELIRTSESGWGLMEIIVGILMTAIVGFISLHLINLGIAMFKLSSGAKDVALKLETAKQLAITQNKDIGVIFDSKENRFGVDRNGNGRLETAEVEELPDGIMISKDGHVIFSRTGKLTKDSREPSIVIRNTRDTKRVNVSSMGSIEIE